MKMALNDGYDLSKIPDICLTGAGMFTLSNQAPIASSPEQVLAAHSK
jgi:hypothetical protein